MDCLKVKEKNIEMLKYWTLVGHPSSDGITIKIPFGVDVLLHQPASYPIFSYCVG